MCEIQGRIAALAGYIRANACEHPDIWISIWCADKSVSGAGMELLDALPACGARMAACNNIRPQVVSLYRFLGYEACRLPPITALRTVLPTRLHALRKNDSACGRRPGSLPVQDARQLAQVYVPHPELRPFRTCVPDAPLLFLSAALRPVAPEWFSSGHTHGSRQRTAVLRIVDYVGLPEQFPEFGPGINRLMQQVGAEYADCYCAGISAAQVGICRFRQRAETDANILPNYLTPP